VDASVRSSQTALSPGQVDLGSEGSAGALSARAAGCSFEFALGVSMIAAREENRY